MGQLENGAHGEAAAKGLDQRAQHRQAVTRLLCVAGFNLKDKQDTISDNFRDSLGNFGDLL